MARCAVRFCLLNELCNSSRNTRGPRCQQLLHWCITCTHGAVSNQAAHCIRIWHSAFVMTDTASFRRLRCIQQRFRCCLLHTHDRLPGRLLCLDSYMHYSGKAATQSRLNESTPRSSAFTAVCSSTADSGLYKQHIKARVMRGGADLAVGMQQGRRETLCPALLIISSPRHVVI